MHQNFMLCVLAAFQCQSNLALCVSWSALDFYHAAKAVTRGSSMRKKRVTRKFGLPVAVQLVAVLLVFLYYKDPKPINAMNTFFQNSFII